MSFLHWIPEPTTINQWTYLSININPNAIQILEENPDKISWNCLSQNPNAIHILEKNPDKIVWYQLSQTLSSHTSTPEFNRTTTPPSGAPLFSKIVIYNM